MKKLRKATTALLAVPSRLATVGKRAPSPTSHEKAITVETPDGIEAIPVEMTGLLLSSPSGQSMGRTVRAVGRRTPTSGIKHAAPPGGAVVDSRDDDEGGRPTSPRGLGLAGRVRTLSRHRTFLVSLEDELTGGAAALSQESRTDPERSRTLSAHGDFLASLEEELTRDAAAMIRGAELAAAGDVPSSTAVRGAVPEGGGVNEAVKCPSPIDAEDSGSLRLSSSWLNITREDSFVSALTKRDGVFDSTIGFETIADPIDIIFDAAARALQCRNGAYDSTGDYSILFRHISMSSTE